MHPRRAAGLNQSSPALPPPGARPPQDLQLLEAALAGALELAARLEPHGYGWAPCSTTVRFTSGLGQEVEAALSYPASCQPLPAGEHSYQPPDECWSRRAQAAAGEARRGSQPRILAVQPLWTAGQPGPAPEWSG
jgi:hypothetical protein